MKTAVLSGNYKQAESVAIQLNAMGYECSIQTQSNLFLQSGRVAEYGLFIVDLDTCADSMDLTLVTRVRSATDGVKPILVLTDGDLDDDGVAELFVAGADCHMRKPLRTGEFAARVGAILRRAYPESVRSANLIQIGDYELDSECRRVTLRGKLLKLSRLEFDLGLYFFRNIGRMVPRAALEKAIWGRSLEYDSKTLDTHIYRLRMKLLLKPENGLQLSCVYAQGFRLTPVQSVVSTPKEAFPHYLAWAG